MAGISTKEIKNRIRSMQSTKQITKAMEMVAASKLRKAQAKVLSSRPYFEILYQTIHEIVDADRELNSPYLIKRGGNRAAYVVIAGDRGLAGGYNSNVLKLAMAAMEDKEAYVLPVGKKASDFFRSRSITVLDDSWNLAESISIGDCFTMAKNLCSRYLAGQLDEIYLVYTNFVTVLSQTPGSLQLLPLLRQESAAACSSDTIYEPDSATVFATIVPEYLGGLIYGALCESRAAEQAARRTAMDSATQNADEMIGELSLQFNRARQASITQEITEIVAGAQEN